MRGEGKANSSVAHQFVFKITYTVQVKSEQRDFEPFLLQNSGATKSFDGKNRDVVLSLSWLVPGHPIQTASSCINTIDTNTQYMDIIALNTLQRLSWSQMHQ